MAYSRALEDAGLAASDIDDMTLMVEMDKRTDLYLEGLGVSPRCAVSIGGWLEQVPKAAMRLALGRSNTAALIFAAPFRTGARLFGGTDFEPASERDSYAYYHPWRWSSQAAHWAFMWQYYMSAYGAVEADLGAVAQLLRANATRVENAVMKAPLTEQAYLQSRYIVKPLHLFDLCLTNDGAVCIVMQRADAAAHRPHTPVLLSGWSHATVVHDKMEAMVKDRLGSVLQAAGTKALAMAGRGLAEIGLFMGYDASTIHLVNQLEGFGFAPPGEGLDLVRSGETDIGGKIPINTNGGMLSHSYMAGWNNLAEAVTQLRHEAGDRQVRDVNVALFAATSTESTHPIVLSRGHASA